MLCTDSTKLCNWAKGTAKWAPRLNGPYSPNFTVPQLWLCKMRTVPPCHCKMTAQINSLVFVKGLSPKLWVSSLPWLGKWVNAGCPACISTLLPCQKCLSLVLLQAKLLLGMATATAAEWGSLSQNAHLWACLLCCPKEDTPESSFSWLSMMFCVWPHWFA